MGNLTSRENGGNGSQGSNSHDDSGDVRERPSKRLKVSRTSVAISNDTNEENKNDVIKTLTLPPEVWAMVSLRCTIFNSHSLGITTYANLLVKHDICHLNICTNWSNMTSVT